MVEPNPKLPKYEDIIHGARMHAVAYAMMASRGNISWAADWSTTSRRTIREWLKRGGLYPWQGTIYTPLELTDLLTPPVFESAGVIEDGRKGLVSFKCENVQTVTGMQVGPAFLIREDVVDRLWPGEWVTYHRARTYALRNGHDF